MNSGKFLLPIKQIPVESFLFATGNSALRAISLICGLVNSPNGNRILGSISF